MNIKSTLSIFSEVTKKELEILEKKSKDYASDQDVLSVFKNTAVTCKTKPELIALNLLSIKIERISTLLNSGKDPENESLQDNIGDLRNYAFLLLCILLDKKVEFENE